MQVEMVTATVAERSLDAVTIHTLAAVTCCR